MEADSAIKVQHHIRENAEDVQNFLLDLASWEKDMQKKDEELKNSRICDDEELPPIRNSSSKGKKKNRHKKQKDKNSSPPKANTSNCDHKDSDENDMDTELNNVDKEQSSTSENNEEEEEEDEEVTLQKRKQLAIFHKDKGNEYFKKGNFDQAIGCYTTGMELDPDNALLPANRAMAFLKKQQFQAADNDCTLCLSIDPTYVKAYLRRGTARSGLKKLDLAKQDFKKALELEPGNKQASQELKKLKKISCGGSKKIRQDSISDEEVIKAQNFWPQFLGHKNSLDSNDESSVSVEETAITTSTKLQLDTKYDDSCIVNPVQKSVDERSKKPLMDIKIVDVSPLSDVPAKAEAADEMVTSEAKSVPETSKKDPAESSSASAVAFSVTVKNVTEKFKFSLPPVPQTSFQFLSDWKKVKKNPDLAYQYLKQFPPKRFPTIFKHSMDTELYTDILHTLSTSFLEKGEDVFMFMRYLSEIGRFNTLLMFLSSSEQKELKKILDSIKASRKTDSEVYKVMKRYNAT